MTDLRALTGIPGLDHLLRGGLPAHRLHLVEGDPGTGKTTLALQFLMTGRDQGESTLYVSLSETAAELRGVADSHGWDLAGIEVFELSPPGGRSDDQYTLYHPAEIELTEMVGRVLEVTERVRPSRVVLDSLSEMRLLARDPLRYRRQILALKEYFAGRECTVLMLDDRTSDAHDLQLQSIAHAVVLMEQVAYEYGSSRRRIRIVKVRGVRGMEGYHDFRIRRGGIAVYPQLVPPKEREVNTEPVRSGVAEMDSLLGGGLSRGTCTLFLGPAGVGKSSFAAQYVTAAAETMPCAMYLFDERRATLLERARKLGMNLDEQVASGRVTIEQIEPGEMSPGEFAHMVCQRVDAGARLVMIDSLNGYLHAIPTAHSPLVRMHELLAYLNEKGVATLLVSAQHGVLGMSMASPADVSYLADAVVLFRFFEANGEVRKAVAVVKKRTGGHEAAIRELVVGQNGIRVGAPLKQFHGIMTGVPRYVGGDDPLMNTSGR